MTYDDLLALAVGNQGRVLTTVSGSRFTVGVYLDCPFFIPESRGAGRSDGRKPAEGFLARHNASGSLRPGDFQGVTRNASYFVGLLLADHDPQAGP